MKLPNAVVTRPMKIKDMKTLRISLGIEHVLDHEKYPSPRWWLRNIICMLPKFVQEIELHITPPSSAETTIVTSDETPDWEALLLHYDNLSTYLNSGWYTGPVRKVNAHWARKPGDLEVTSCGSTFLKWTELGYYSKVNEKDYIGITMYMGYKRRSGVVLTLGSMEES